MPGLTFPPSTFAKLTPGPYLRAHLEQQPSTRPSGRSSENFRQPTVNTGSLTHSNGSAVVRVGDTAVVCGVRAEILLAEDVPNPPKQESEDDNVVEELGLLVPNVELSTGCSPAHLPGNPPSTLAQALSYRLNSLLHTARLVNIEDLQISYKAPRTDDDGQDEEPETVIKGYWTLYLDILCMSLDGNAFDAAWGAVMAALQNTQLPRAWWDADREAIICSPTPSKAHRLNLACMPVASTFAVFSTATPLKQRSESQSWLLADPDGFEEDVCRETLTVVLAPAREKGQPGRVLGIEKAGGGVIGKGIMKRCVELAESRWSEWELALRAG
ncbi:hypothetical protein MBLNU230_g7572t1 [Neophaeotheca triangularis]